MTTKMFNQLKVGDTIYYYDHCKIKSRVITNIEEVTCDHIVKTYEWGFQTEPIPFLNITCKTGQRVLHVCVLYQNGEFNHTICNHSHYFSNLTAANNYVKNLMSTRKVTIDILKDKINKEKRILSKYSIIKEKKSKKSS